MKPRLWRMLLVLSLFFTACSHVYYAPNMVNEPLFRNKGEFTGNYAGSATGLLAGTELQAAYSVSDKYGAVANFYSGQQDEKNKMTYGEAGGLWYRTLDKNSSAEATASFGYGHIFNTYDMKGSSELTFTKLCFQPGIGLTSDYADLIISSRLGILTYQSISSTGNINAFDQIALAQLRASSSYLLIEPALTLRLGYKNVKLQFQYVFSRNFSNTLLGQQNNNISFGLHILLFRSFSEKRYDLPLNKEARVF